MVHPDLSLADNGLASYLYKEVTLALDSLVLPDSVPPGQAPVDDHGMMPVAQADAVAVDKEAVPTSTKRPGELVVTAFGKNGAFPIAQGNKTDFPL